MVAREMPSAAASARTPSSQGPKLMSVAQGAARTSPAPAKKIAAARANFSIRVIMVPASS
jgi:hypothetical protein